MKTRAFTTTLATIAVAFMLTACGVTDAPAPAESTPAAPVVITPAPETTAPTETATTPPATELEDEVVERNDTGDIILPDGSVAECPDEADAAFVAEDGTVTCDTGVDW